MALVICGIGMALTHYYAVGPIAGLGVWGLMRLPRRAMVRTIIAAAILGCLTLALAHGWIEAKIDWIETNAGWMSDHSPGWIERLAYGIADLPAEFLAEPRLPVMGVAALSAVIFFLPFMVARRQPGMLPCGLWLLGAVGVVAGGDLLTHSDSVQYVRLSLLGAPAFYLILAGMPLRQAWLRHAIPAAGLLGCFMAIPSAYALPLGAKGDWRSVGRDVASHVRPGDVLVIAAGATDFLTTPREVFGYVSYYAAKPFPCPAVLLDSPASPSMDERLKKADRVWVIGCIPQNRAPDFLPRATLAQVTPGRRLAGILYQARWR